ncbi:MAG: hypothetical protein EOP52_09415 [Sphingobacteriales bacterium]|nr:MAG: hypothetical protein EOP52_09415 [Sphingobacteriales bacterium]
MNLKYFKAQSLILTVLSLAVVLEPISSVIETWAGNFEPLKKIVDYVDVFSTIGLITGALAFVNYWGWRWRIFKFLVDIPNLNGRYEGKLISSYLDPQGNPVERDCVMEIKQNSSSLHIYSYYGDVQTGITSSSSKTTLEQLIKEPSGFFILYYIYSNQPGGLISQLSNHDGTAKLTYYPDLKKLSGEYYNRRINTGTFELIFRQKKLLGRLIR